MNSARGTAHGKVILSGEHSVVYGHPGLVAAISLGVTVEVSASKEQLQSTVLHKQQLPFFERISTLFSEKVLNNQDVAPLYFGAEATLPVGVGLGSSAAAAAATLRALAAYHERELSHEQLFELVQDSEKFAHGTPSGIDATAVVYQGITRFQKKDGVFSRQALGLAADSLPKFLLFDSGRSAESTKEMVAYVAARAQQDASYRTVIDEVGHVTEEIHTALRTADQSLLFSRIQRNQELLDQLGIVHPSARGLIETLSECGAVAKITGAGGRTNGSGMIIAFHQQIADLKRFCQQKNIRFVETAVEESL